MSEPCTAVREYSALGHGRRDRIQRHRRRVYASVRGLCGGVHDRGCCASCRRQPRVLPEPQPAAVLRRHGLPACSACLCTRITHAQHTHARTHTHTHVAHTHTHISRTISMILPCTTSVRLSGAVQRLAALLLLLLLLRRRRLFLLLLLLLLPRSSSLTRASSRKSVARECVRGKDPKTMMPYVT